MLPDFFIPCTLLSRGHFPSKDHPRPHFKWLASITLPLGTYWEIQIPVKQLIRRNSQGLIRNKFPHTCANSKTTPTPQNQKQQWNERKRDWQCNQQSDNKQSRARDRSNAKDTKQHPKSNSENSFVRIVLGLGDVLAQFMIQDAYVDAQTHH